MNKYYAITSGASTADVGCLVEWCGEGGYWSNVVTDKECSRVLAKDKNPLCY